MSCRPSNLPARWPCCVANTAAFRDEQACRLVGEIPAHTMKSRGRELDECVETVRFRLARRIPPRGGHIDARPVTRPREKKGIRSARHAPRERARSTPRFAAKVLSSRTYGLLVVSAAGNRKQNVLPAPTTLSTVTEPRWASAMCRTIASPSPVPPNSRLRALSTR
jgi:hypothetical protein